MPLRGPDHYQPHLKQLLGWLGRHWLFRIPRSHLTEGIRPLGRLALIDHADQVLSRLRQSISQVLKVSRRDSSNWFCRLLTGSGGVYVVSLVQLRIAKPSPTSIAGITCPANYLRKVPTLKHSEGYDMSIE